MNITSVEELKAVLKSSSNKACTFFAGNDKFLQQYAGRITRVMVKNRESGDNIESDNSFAFNIGAKSRPKAKDLANLFELESTKGFKLESFTEKFAEAVSGNGKEINRITRLGSSSLLAFLCFHGVSEDNKLTITLGSDLPTLVFNEVHFECQNPISKEPNAKCSNIDILLKGHDMNTSKPVAMFLESKFSEYFNRTSSYKNISAIYEEDYEDFFKGKWQSLEWRKGKDDSRNRTSEIHTCTDTQYCGGIKQLISHYRGLRTISKYGLASTTGTSKTRADVFRFRNGTDVYLGSIVFNLTGKVRDKKDAFTAYDKLYSEFVDHFRMLKDKHFHVLPKLLTYQDVFASQNPHSHFKLADSVRAMYNLK